jgi:hypothetical protein
MRLIVPDATKAALDARLKTLDESKGKLTRLRMRDGVIVHAEFILWYGNHGLFYVPADHMTVAVWVLDLPGML